MKSSCLIRFGIIALCCLFARPLPAQIYTVSTLAGPPASGLVSGAPGYVDGTGNVVRFSAPSSVAVDGSGDVYVADAGNHVIRKVTSGGVATTLAGTAGSAASTDGTGSAAGFSSPKGVAVDSVGNVYVADAGNHVIRKVTSAGVVTTLAGTAGSAGSVDGTGSAARFSSPHGVAVDSSGNVYVADAGNHVIRKVTPGGVVTTLAGTAGAAGSTDDTGSAARFSDPRGVAVGGSGNVYVADSGNHVIRKVTSGGAVTTLAGTAGASGSTDGTGAAARFRNPRGVAVDSSGDLYVVETNNHVIRKVTASGVVTKAAGSFFGFYANGAGNSSGFNAPGGIAVNSSGNLYLADTGNNVIRYVVVSPPQRPTRRRA